MVKSIKFEHDIPMKTRDGVVLKADICRPDDNGKHPAIVARTPYNKTVLGDSDYLRAKYAADAGFVYVIQDTRGRFASGGDFSPMDPDGNDGYDTIEWVASEPWCDGNVGMAGGSYLARTQWWTALENPPHLKAIAPAISCCQTIREPRLSGVAELDFVVGWFSKVAVDMLNKLEKQGKDVSQQRRMLISADSLELDNYLPLRSIPHFKFEGLPDNYWLKIAEALPPGAQTADDLHWYYPTVRVPCFHSTGWYDVYTNSTFINFFGMRDRGGTGDARRGQYLTVGPWPHDVVLSPVVGGLSFGLRASERYCRIQERHIAFFNKYLRGINGPEMAPVHYFVMGPNQWRDAPSWPLPQTQWQRCYLHSRGKANTFSGDGRLTQDVPGTESPDRFIYDPMDPVPTMGGRVGSNLSRGPIDQTNIEKRIDVLCYTSQALKKPLEVTGPLKVHLFASTSAKDTDFMAKLVDVHPNGCAYNIAEGCIRARYRDSVIVPQFPVPGQTYEYVIDLAHTSIVFGTGHQIRIEITSSNFPKIDRNMNTGNAFGEDADGIPAMQTVFHDAQYASYIDLPVIPINSA